MKVNWAGPAETKASWTRPTLGGARKALALTHLGARMALPLVSASAVLTHVGAR